ncbi:hypothetical protein Dsin_013509 [Dipteronia sinensis]|uniref:Uncharacterized protein n=1 Tax=Dipteronia sinensis TaxID=43782 RepID=A0AAE0ALB0_9ROSI|nr:hypothetical protein Dsin_013509 [Dipteronia sinensis]
MNSKISAKMLQSSNSIQLVPTCLGSCCPRHCCTSYRLGKQVSKKITKLIEKGSSVVVADKVPRPMIDEIPMEKTVEMESSLDEVWKFVEGHKVGIIWVIWYGRCRQDHTLKET